MKFPQMPFLKKKDEIPKEQLLKDKARHAAQTWMPIKDIYNSMIYRKDNQVVTGIRVSPINMPLLSLSEQKLRIRSLFEVYNGFEGEKKMFTIPRPVDLDGFIMKIEDKKNEEENFSKKKILEADKRRAIMMASTGEAVERHFYFLIMAKLGKNPQLDIDVLMKRTNEFASNLTGAGLNSHMCNDQDLRDLLFLFGNPNQAAFERAPQHNGPYLINQDIF